MHKTDKAALLKQLLAELDDSPESTEPARYPEHHQAIKHWTEAMASGTLTGKPFSHHTVANYARYVVEHLEKHPNLSFESLSHELQETPASMFGRKDKYFKAMICFGKFLIRYNSLPPRFLEQANEIKPKRHLPPSQAVINEKQLEAILTVSNDYQRLIISFLISTGLRASEFCYLNTKDLDFEQGIVTVRCGKGGKRRRVGLAEDLCHQVQEYLATRKNLNPDSPIWIDLYGNRITRDGLIHRFKRIGRLAGIHFSPHMLRRAFVTINANKGRSLVMLQMACGHADIKTTRSYCKTTEDEMIQAMKDWK